MTPLSGEYGFLSLMFLIITDLWMGKKLHFFLSSHIFHPQWVYNIFWLDSAVVACGPRWGWKSSRRVSVQPGETYQSCQCGAL